MSSLPDTPLDISVSKTPDFKSATSIFEIELPVPSTSNVLFVNVAVEDVVTKRASPPELGSVIVFVALSECGAPLMFDHVNLLHSLIL